MAHYNEQLFFGALSATKGNEGIIYSFLLLDLSKASKLEPLFRLLCSPAKRICIWKFVS